MAGTGDMLHGSIEMAANLGIGHKVLFTRFLRGTDVDKAYKMADLFEIAQSRLLSLLGHCDYSFHSQVRDIAKGREYVGSSVDQWQFLVLPNPDLLSLNIDQPGELSPVAQAVKNFIL
jgi:hypothetical protein